VDTSKGKTSADAYVVAMGSYSAPLLRSVGIRIPVYPLKGYSITLPLGPVEETTAPTVSLTDEAHKIVISRLGARLRAAGTAELDGYDTSLNEVRCAAIVRRVRRLFPQLGAATTVERWAGLRPATPNNVPIIGATKLRRLWVNTGHGTLGWTLACGSASALADLVSGRRPQVEFPFAH
jgi:D-amino-acid dehydrogenase